MPGDRASRAALVADLAIALRSPGFQIDLPQCRPGGCKQYCAWGYYPAVLSDAAVSTSEAAQYNKGGTYVSSDAGFYSERRIISSLVRRDFCNLVC